MIGLKKVANWNRRAALRFRCASLKAIFGVEVRNSSGRLIIPSAIIFIDGCLKHLFDFKLS